MNKRELAAAMDIARSNKELNVDDSILDGLYLNAFQPVTTTLEVIAKSLRWHCFCLNGNVDENELNNMANALRRKVQIV